MRKARWTPPPRLTLLHPENTRSSSSFISSKKEKVCGGNKNVWNKYWLLLRNFISSAFWTFSKHLSPVLEVVAVTKQNTGGNIVLNVGLFRLSSVSVDQHERLQTPNTHVCFLTRLSGRIESSHFQVVVWAFGVTRTRHLQSQCYRLNVQQETFSVF